MTKTKKQLPSLASQLGNKGDGLAGRQTVGQMKTALSVISQQFGIPLRKKTRG